MFGVLRLRMGRHDVSSAQAARIFGLASAMFLS
jgi:hypothetical protein